jgi:AAA+ ATPase superfamily predicted ATPase
VNINSVSYRSYEYLYVKSKINIVYYIGHIFEDISINFLIKSNIISFNKIGNWWYKDSEIDIVALNNMNNEIIFFECKWKTLNEHDVNSILMNLKNKARKVKWKTNRKERFGVIAKEIKNREKLDKNYIIIDLSDFNRFSLDFRER